MKKSIETPVIETVELVKANGNEKRKTWFIASCCIAGVLLIGTICYQFIAREFAVDSLLATILALFSVGISILFYFKADSSSAKFYEKVYEFNNTQEALLKEIKIIFNQKFDDVLRLMSELQNSKDKVREIQEKKDNTDDENERRVYEEQLARLREKEYLISLQLQSILDKQNNLNEDDITDKRFRAKFLFCLIPQEELARYINTGKVEIKYFREAQYNELVRLGLIEKSGMLTEEGTKIAIDAYVWNEQIKEFNKQENATKMPK